MSKPGRSDEHPHDAGLFEWTNVCTRGLRCRGCGVAEGVLFEQETSCRGVAFFHSVRITRGHCWAAPNARGPAGVYHFNSLDSKQDR